jgi:glycosyltransferase involved in cell wall biosynthesis
MKIVIVITRYGGDVVGGQETLVREFAERLCARGHEVTVLATCVRSLGTWADELPAGATSENGVRVERFPTVPRDHELAGRIQHAINAGLDLPESMQRAWVRNTGYSPGLQRRLDELALTSDVLLFAGYLFSSTVDGALRQPSKSVVLPLLHDEPNARFATTGNVLRGVAGLIFNTAAERDLGERLWGPLPPSSIVGGGVATLGAAPDVQRWRDHRGITGDVIAHAGRRGEGDKNLPLLIEAVTAYNLMRRGGEPLLLVTMGSGTPAIPRSARPYVVDLGFVSDAERLAWQAAAIAVANLSLNESLSLVLLEGWSVGTPAIVHADCDVTRRACAESSGGLWVTGVDEFVAAVDRLRDDPALRQSLADAGLRYVARRYSWDAVMDRLEAALGLLVPAPVAGP